MGTGAGLVEISDCPLFLGSNSFAQSFCVLEEPVSLQICATIGSGVIEMAYSFEALKMSGCGCAGLLWPFSSS